MEDFIKVPEAKEREKWNRNNFEKIIAENIPQLVKNIVTH